MQHPFQCLAATEQHLIAACGPKLLNLSLEDGTLVSEWSPQQENEDEPPAKKQKTSNEPTIPSVIRLAVSPDQQHAVAVTDDKAVRVFAIQEQKLVELSQRVLPKRPCAVEILPDNATILCGDKFGDVYSLPLIYVPTENGAETPAPKEEEKPAPAESQFKPSATTFTVHTQRNRLALEAQMKQKNLTPKSKEPLKFEHKLLLGHVSMLTDHKFATREVDGKQRGYIITADRDEHIRVSRGPPQAHVIEGYCLGHTEFISKICLIPGTDLLVSGGGDDWIGVWEWPCYKLVRKLDIKTAVSALTPDSRVNVSGLWTADNGSEQFLVAASEKINAIFVIPTKSLTDDTSAFSTINLPKAPLDVACVAGKTIVSMDSRSDGEALTAAFDLGESTNDQTTENKLQSLNSAASSEITDKELDGFLYGIANLRKRGDREGNEEQNAE